LLSSKACAASQNQIPFFEVQDISFIVSTFAATSHVRRMRITASRLDFYERTLILAAPRRVVDAALETAVRERTQ